jgi:hypothetical protein
VTTYEGIASSIRTTSRAPALAGAFNAAHSGCAPGSYRFLNSVSDLGKGTGHGKLDPKDRASLGSVFAHDSTLVFL